MRYDRYIYNRLAGILYIWDASQRVRNGETTWLQEIFAFVATFAGFIGSAYVAINLGLGLWSILVGVVGAAIGILVGRFVGWAIPWVIKAPFMFIGWAVRNIQRAANQTPEERAQIKQAREERKANPEYVRQKARSRFVGLIIALGLVPMWGTALFFGGLAIAPPIAIYVSPPLAIGIFAWLCFLAYKARKKSKGLQAGTVTPELAMSKQERVRPERPTKKERPPRTKKEKPERIQHERPERVVRPIAININIQRRERPPKPPKSPKQPKPEKLRSPWPKPAKAMIVWGALAVPLALLLDVVLITVGVTALSVIALVALVALIAGIVLIVWGTKKIKRVRLNPVEGFEA